MNVCSYVCINILYHSSCLPSVFLYKSGCLSSVFLNLAVSASVSVSAFEIRCVVIRISQKKTTLSKSSTARKQIYEASSIDVEFF